MRRSFIGLLIGTFSISSLSGCLTTFDAKSSGQMRCAEMGQIYSGFTVTGTRNFSDVGYVNCKVPETEKEKCEVQQYQSTIAQGEALNDKWFWKRFATGFGYCLYFVPGYIGYKLWNDENAADYNSLYSENNSRIQSCGKLNVAH